LLSNRNRASRGSCPHSDDFRLVSRVASPRATDRKRCSHYNNQHCGPRSCSKLCSRLERLRLTGGRTIIFVHFFEFPIVLVVRYNQPSRQTDPVVCLASLRQMSRELDCHEPHQCSRTFGSGTGRDQESDMINFKPSVLLQPRRSAESVRGCDSIWIESAMPSSQAAREGHPITSRRRGNSCPGRSIRSLLRLDMIPRAAYSVLAKTHSNAV
jgi:hypothetical protein